MMRFMSQAQPVSTELSRIISPRKLYTLLGVSHTTLWRMRRTAGLPDPIRLSPGRVGWPESQIQEWLDSRTANKA